MTRLLNHIKQVSCSKVICKHCEQDFNFKNKLHDHIREHHTQKLVTSFVTSKNSNLRFSTSEFTYKIKEKLSINSLTSSISSSSTSVRKHQKLYLIIDDLSRMFRGKSRSFDLRQYQKDSASSQRFDTSSSRQSHFFSMHQSRIISYFLSAVNQKTSISQSLKSSNSKNFQQHTFAKSISLCRSALSEKSTFSSYKMTDIFYISLQSRFSSRFSFA